ncbi:D-alanyl-D-alanine carboxypeptidase family protein [Anaerocolumna sp. MB42-C2]|uniref:D-alanyl-D-alanine carboxypeptidase family protein n=1 Tax=Anaerocolumna sp. MB42-C2 TaxID=3070997 RepID=UPI0027E0198F|nr:D-alanyl-D-alanine carboxypeptidase [Anaerocolumna sp. MB42-C2]WMJ87351.1 D-alanyl-D-alanine carboxypeptidase [Anaerocolumna sp. MB42-C2]
MNYYNDNKRKRRRRKILIAKLYCILLLGMLSLVILMTLLITDYKGVNLKKLPDALWEELNYLASGQEEVKSDTNLKRNRFHTEDTQKLEKQDNKLEPVKESDYNNEEKITADKSSKLSFDMENLYSPEAILFERDNGSIIADKNSDKKIYPASMTKIMTAILAIENITDINEKLEIPSDIYQDLYAEDASVAGFEPGEVAAAKDLIYGILLPSGAECCLTIAFKVSGSETEFADLMNIKAEELGMDNTHFSNSTGLHNEDHYTTVKDMALLLNYALKNDVFRSIFTSSRYTVSSTNKHPEGFTFVSTMFKAMDYKEVYGGEILGGKTGYTSEAGLCLASLANIEGKDYILVTAGAKGNHSTEQLNVLDAFSVYDQIGRELANADQK